MDCSNWKCSNQLKYSETCDLDSISINEDGCCMNFSKRDAESLKAVEEIRNDR